MALPIFPPPDDMTTGALFFMMMVYGFVLLKASQTIGDGCEMLVLLYGPGIIGSLVIPILGALPDCLIILLSGLGSGTPEEIQAELSIGVGTLVGSTVMLLTVPWALGVYLGRRDLVNGVAKVKKPLLTQGFDMSNTGVTTLDDVPVSAKILMMLSLGYWVIQIPAFFYHNQKDGGTYAEKPWALACLIFSFLTFCAYCWFQLYSSEMDEKVRREQEVQKHKEWRQSLKAKYTLGSFEEAIFNKFDKDKNGKMDIGELFGALNEMGLKLERRDLKAIMEACDIDDPTGISPAGDGMLSLHEFKLAVKTWMDGGWEGVGADAPGTKSQKMDIGDQESHSFTEALNPKPVTYLEMLKKNIAADAEQQLAEHAAHQGSVNGSQAVAETEQEEDGLEDEEEEEEEENFWELTDSQLKFKAMGLLVAAIAVVSIFSDPMVDVINSFGKAINIPPFYVSFVLTPLASNASEVFAGLIFASKKTNSSISLCHSSLLGGASMNASLALSVFMALIYFRGLHWSFSAEIITVFLVSCIVAVNSWMSTTVKMWQAVLVGSLYPLSIVFIYILESVFGLD